MRCKYIAGREESGKGRRSVEYRIRAHHGMCFAFFRGKGYSGDFTENMWRMKERLEQNPEVVLLQETDDVCARCPNNRNGRCISTAAGEESGGTPLPEKAAGYDRQVFDCCGLAPGSRMKWKDFADLVREHILEAGKREAICGDCQWNALCKEG